MPHNQNSTLGAWREGIRLLVRRSSLHDVVLLAAFPFAVAPSLFFDQVRLHQSAAESLVLALAGYLIPVMIVIFFRDVILSRLGERIRVWHVMACFVVAGLARGATIYLLGREFGTTPESDLLYRLIGAPIYVILGLSILGILNTQWVDYRSELNALDSEQSKLRMLQNEIRNEIESQQALFVGRVQGLLEPAIYELNKFLASDKGLKVSVAVSRLNETLEKVIRPLSRLAGTPRELTIEDQTQNFAAPSTLKLPRRVNLSEMIGSELILVLTMLFITSPTIVSHGLVEGVIGIVVTTAVVWLFCGLAKLVFRKLVAPLIPTLLLIFGWGFLAGTVAMAVGHWVDLDLVSQIQIEIPWMIGTISLLSFANELVKGQRKKTIEDRKQVIGELGRLNSRLRQEVWQNQRRTANILHGPIQGAIYASAIRLSKAKRISKSLIEEIQNDINNSVEKLSLGNQPELFDFDSSVAQIIDLWQDIAPITLQVQNEIPRILKAQPITSECLLEIVREGVSNAIRHGKANQVDIEIALRDREVISVRITNDGSADLSVNQAGYGTKLLDEITHSWNLTRQGEVTIFEAQLVTSL
jgi:hypothetical protein